MDQERIAVVPVLMIMPPSGTAAMPRVRAVGLIVLWEGEPVVIGRKVQRRVGIHRALIPRGRVL